MNDTEKKIRHVNELLMWMTSDDIEANYPINESTNSTDLDDLAKSENRDRNDIVANRWQLATDIVCEEKTLVDSPEQAVRDRELCGYDYKIGEYRQFFTTPFDQYEEHLGKPFVAVKRLPDAEPAEEGSEGEDMHLIRFEDGTEIEAWGHECCLLLYGNCN